LAGIVEPDEEPSQFNLRYLRSVSAARLVLIGDARSCGGTAVNNRRSFELCAVGPFRNMVSMSETGHSRPFEPACSMSVWPAIADIGRTCVGRSN